MIPWDDCKIAFSGCSDVDLIWEKYDMGKIILPQGWELIETDSSGCRVMIVFRVTIVPTAEDGKAVLETLKRLKLICNSQ